MGMLNRIFGSSESIAQSAAYDDEIITAFVHVFREKYNYDREKYNS